jgi:hypothetical protein
MFRAVAFGNMSEKNPAIGRRQDNAGSCSVLRSRSGLPDSRSCIPVG